MAMVQLRQKQNLLAVFLLHQELSVYLLLHQSNLLAMVCFLCIQTSQTPELILVDSLGFFVPRLLLFSGYHCF